MTMSAWKANNQTEASDAKKAAFETAFEVNVSKDT